MKALKFSFVPSWSLTIGTVVTFLCSLIVVGHGVVPMGLLLVLGFSYQLNQAIQSPMFVTIFLGWLGIILLLSGKSFNKSSLCIFGFVAMLVSWTIILWNAEIPQTLAFSFPFLICLFFWGVNWFTFQLIK